MARHLPILLLVFFATPLVAQEGPPATLLTHAERQGWSEVSPHSTVVDFYDELSARSPEVAVRRFGESAQGRELLEVVISRPSVTGPWEAHASGRPVVLINAQVHGDEQASKEAVMLLARDLAVGPLNPLLDEVIFVLSPQLNPDGAESGDWGSRNNRMNRNVNRDYLRLDAPESRAFVEEVIGAWRPHVIVDVHELIGPPRIYDFYTSFPRSIEGPTHNYALTRSEIVPAIVDALEAEGFDHFPYHRVSGAVIEDPSIGVSAGTYGARALSSYGGARGAITLLYESMRPRDAREKLESRTRRHHVALEALVRYVAEHPEAVVETVRRERAELVERGARWDPADSVAIQLEQVASRELDYRVEWQGDTLHFPVPLLDSTVIEMGRVRPVGYVIEPHREEAARHLALHGVQVERLLAPVEIEGWSYVVESVERASISYEGYVSRTFETELVEPDGPVPAGSFLVRMDQPDARIIAHLLEPEDENSLASMGWFATSERSGASLGVHRLQALPATPAEQVTRVDGWGRTLWIGDRNPDGLAGAELPGIEGDVAPRTPAEVAGWDPLTPHREVVAFYRTLAARSPEMTLHEIGRSREGRPLHLAILAGGGIRTPAEAHASGRPILFIGAQVHGDEPAGKEGLMQFTRDLTEGPLASLLDEMVFLFVPQMNPDGAEAGTWGIRPNTAGYNLNRDALRLDNPESRAIVDEVLIPWRPHVVVDAHELPGPPRVYDFYTWHPTNPHGPAAPMHLAGDALIPAIVDALEASGSSHIIYHTPGGLNRLAEEPEVGIRVPVYGRTLNDYAASQGLATILFESLRESDARVDIEDRATRQRVAMEALARAMAADPEGVRGALHDGRREMAERGGRWDEADSIAVLREPIPSRTVDYDVAEYRSVETPEGTRLQATGEVITVEAPLYDSSRVTLGRTRPVGYLVEPHRGDLVRALLDHGIRVERLMAGTEWEVERFHIDSLELSSSVYEGYVPQTFRTSLEADRHFMPAGSWFVPADQPGGALVFHLMEPDDENSFAITGAFLSEARVGGGLPVHRVRERAPVARRIETEEGPALRAGVVPTPADGTPGVWAAEQDAFWNRLLEHCGRAYHGTVSDVTPYYADGMDDVELTMHVMSCEEDRIHIPFHIDDNRSRNWILTRVDGTIRLKHDHRNPDGTEEEISQYGGDAPSPGLPTRQIFPADAHTAAILPDRADNFWFFDFSDDDVLEYGVHWPKFGHSIRVEFDLSTPVDPPPRPWGY